MLKYHFIQLTILVNESWWANSHGGVGVFGVSWSHMVYDGSFKRKCRLKYTHILTHIQFVDVTKNARAWNGTLWSCDVGPTLPSWDTLVLGLGLSFMKNMSGAASSLCKMCWAYCSACNSIYSSSNLFLTSLTKTFRCGVESLSFDVKLLYLAIRIHRLNILSATRLALLPIETMPQYSPSSFVLIYIQPLLLSSLYTLLPIC